MAQEISTEEELEVLLASLGDSADAVATSLEVAGIKGIREESACCPVANWLRRETGARYVAVDLQFVAVRNAGSERLRVSAPVPVNNFIAGFDDHGYPELDEHPDPLREIPRDDD